VKEEFTVVDSYESAKVGTVTEVRPTGVIKPEICEEIYKHLCGTGGVFSRCLD
jgi:hypothetical protein